MLAGSLLLIYSFVDSFTIFITLKRQKEPSSHYGKRALRVERYHLFVVAEATTLITDQHPLAK